MTRKQLEEYAWQAACLAVIGLQFYLVTVLPLWYLVCAAALTIESIVGVQDSRARLRKWRRWERRAARRA